MSIQKEDIIIEIEGLTKKYKKFRALDNINLKVSRGQCLVLLGPNGAGKTTLLHLIIGILRYNVGKINIFGLDLKKDYIEIYKKVGFLPENQGFNLNQTGYQLIQYILNLRGFRNKRPDDVLEEVGLRRFFWNKNIQTYSRGMKQRLGIAQAIAGDPQLIIMDEPFQNLDPVGCENLIDIINFKVRNGATVIFSSHVISEIEDIATDILLVNRGKIRLNGDLLQLPVNSGFFNYELKSDDIEQLYKEITNSDSNIFRKLFLDDVILFGDYIFVKTNLPKTLLKLILDIDRSAKLYPAKGVIQKLYKKYLEYNENE